MIKIRQKIEELNDFVDYNPITMSGSRAEGLDMKGSDFDFMYSIGEAHEETLRFGNVDYYTYDSLDYKTCPGFVSVKFIGKDPIGPAYHVSSDVLKTWFQECLSCINMDIHGPAFRTSMYCADVDLVYCLKSLTWPRIAYEWIYRERQYEWPTDDMILDIVSNGCHIVPVSSKVDESNSREWGLSFSMAENRLVHSFNHVQMLIYGFLKLVLKEIIDNNENLENLLCSYFLKTTLFWVIEKTKPELWNPKYTTLCFTLCLDKFIEYVKEENCPNYFVEINNMFLGRFNQSQKELLLHSLYVIKA